MHGLYNVLNAKIRKHFHKFKCFDIEKKLCLSKNVNCKRMRILSNGTTSKQLNVVFYTLVYILLPKRQ